MTRIGIALLAAVLVGGGAAAGAFAVLRSKIDGTASPPPARAAPPSPVPASDAGRVYGLGTVEGKVVSRLGFEVAGRVADMAADQGETVARGQVLARIDSSEQEARLAQTEADVKQAEAALAQANARLERARAVLAQRRSINERRQTLARRGTVSQEAAEDAVSGSAVATADVAVAVSDVDAARGTLDAAHARVQLERAVLAKFTLTAPFDGLMVERLHELGSTVATGATVLTLVDPGTVWVRAYVDESLSGGLAVGQAADIVLRSQPDRPLTGRVARIDVENDRVAEERRVHVAFETIPRPFHLGEQAEVFIAVGGDRP